jgi:hypothetical protein
MAGFNFGNRAHPGGNYSGACRVKRFENQQEPAHLEEELVKLLTESQRTP